MRVKMNSHQDLQLPGALLWTVTLLLLVTRYSTSSDPCPSASKLSPCWCTDFSLNGNYYTTASTWNGTSNLQPTTTTTIEPTSAGTSVPPTITTPEPVRRRRRDTFSKRQVPYSLGRNSYYTVVTCNNTNNTHDLEEVLGEGLKRRWIDKLVISNIQPANEDALLRLPNRWLKNTRVTHFEIRNTLLSGDFIHFGSPFDGQNQSMMWFAANNCSLGGQLSYSDIGTLNTMGLNFMMRLEGVDFSRNHLASIRDMAFRYPPANLTTIILSYNNIRVIDFRAFQYTPKLSNVDLSHNRLESIQRSIFASPARNLHHINLSWNLLTVLPTDLFVNMPALKIFNISNNYLYSMPSNPWAAGWRQLRTIDVTGNYLPCDCSFLWLLSILSHRVANGTSTQAPTVFPGQTVLGSCSYFQLDSYPRRYDLASLTRSSLIC